MPQLRAARRKTEYVPEFGRSVSIAEFDRPMSTDEVETGQTVAYMDELADRDAGAQSVIEAAQQALDDACIDTAAPAIEKARAVFWYLKKLIRYVPTPGTSPLVDQTLIAPTAILAMPEAIGDCPQFSMLAAAMFRVLCVPCYFKTIAAEKNFPDQFSHIYNVVEIGPGQFLPFDSSNGPEPGAEYSAPFKSRVWPRIAPDKCGTGGKEKPVLHTQYHGAGYRGRRLRGALGDATDPAAPDIVTGPVYVDASGNTSYTPATPDIVSGPVYVDASGNTSYTPPAAPSSAGNILTTLINDATQAAAPAIKAAFTQAPYYVTGPNGQAVLYNPNTGTTGAAIGSLGTLSPAVLLMGGAALFLLLMLGKK